MIKKILIHDFREDEILASQKSIKLKIKSILLVVLIYSRSEQVEK